MIQKQVCDIEYLCVRVGGLSPTPRTRYLNKLAREGWRLICVGREPHAPHDDLLYLRKYRHEEVEGEENASREKKQADCHQGNKQQKTAQAMAKNFEGGNK